MKHYPSTIYEKSCGVLLTNASRILLLHYPSGHWDFPKGHTAAGETEQQTALRELREETGIDNPSIDNHFRHVTEYVFKRQRALCKKKVVFFLATSNTCTVELSEEHIDYLWAPIKDASNILTFDSSKEVLEKALTYLSKPSKPLRCT